jgi:hypothetical protein
MDYIMDYIIDNIDYIILLYNMYFASFIHKIEDKIWEGLYYYIKQFKDKLRI